MLGYASEHPLRAPRARPGTLGLVLAGHAAALLMVLTARSELPERIRNLPIVVTPIPEVVEPEPIPPEAQPPQSSSTSHVTTHEPIIGDLTSAPAFDSGPIELPTFDDPVGEPALPPTPPIDQPPVLAGPRLATAGDRLRPPYPESKRRLEEEATLKLRLTIGSDGRVTTVTPIGAADALFLNSAREQILRHWRYHPATENGRPVQSTLTVTIRFELDGD